MQISELMSPCVETIAPEATLQEAATRMRTCGIGALPVLEGDQLVGMLTDRDITVRATALGKDPRKTLVHEVMTCAVVTCREDAPIAEAERLMEQKAVRRLVVLDARHRVVGLISLDDIAAIPGESQRVGEILEQLNEA